MKMTTTALATALALALAGCATAPPNTPGAGVGATYTPIIDTTGVNFSRYYADLDSCRTFARQIDVNQQELNGIIAGALFGAMLGAAAGGNSRYVGNTAAVGGTAGGVRAGNRALGKQETIVANCMASRGYRVLEGATIPAATNVPSPYADAGPAVVTPVAAPINVDPSTYKAVSVQGAPAAAPPRAFRPASCDWPGVKQGQGAC
jgi:outer membrane lipoprotein SlyB